MGTHSLHHELLEELVHVLHLQFLKSEASSYNKFITIMETAHNFDAILHDYSINKKTTVKESKDG